MSSRAKTKTEIPLQLVTESSKAEKLIITVDAANPNKPTPNDKEEAGKPLYLKRV